MNAARAVTELRRRGHEVHVFTRSTGDSGGEVRPMRRIDGGASVWEVNYQASDATDVFLRDFYEGASFVRGLAACPVFAASSFDAVHVHHWTSGIGLDEVLPQEVPLVFTPHLLPSEKARTLGVALDSRVVAQQEALLRRATAIIALSLDERAAIGSQHERRTILAPNHLDERFFGVPPAIAPLPGRMIRLGSIGRLCRQKGQDILLTALEDLLQTGVDASLEIVGQSYDEPELEAEIRRRADSPPLRGRVSIVTDADHGDIPERLRQWDLYVQPSRYESQGIALLEAMAAARVVVATGLGAIREYVDDRQSGFLINDPPTSSELAREISLALNCDEWERVSANARRSARRFRSPGNLVTRTLEAAATRSGWNGDRHSEAEASSLREAATVRAAELEKRYPGATILLIGSAARGPARAGSDIDLAVVCCELRVPVRQEWHADGTRPFDIRVFSKSHINELATSNDELFCAQNAETWTADLLDGAEVLANPDEALSDALRALDRMRSREGVQQRLSRIVREEARKSAAGADAHARAFALADAQLELYQAAQLALTAGLVRRGWRLQGAKRRPEIAAAIGRSDPSLVPLLDAVSTAVGFGKPGRSEVAEMIEQRHRLRQELMHEFVRANAPQSDILRLERHTPPTSASYYGEALALGMQKGVVHHIRCHSGVPRVPSALANLHDARTNHPASWCLRSKAVPRSLLGCWEFLCPTPPTRDGIERPLSALRGAIEGEEHDS